MPLYQQIIVALPKYPSVGLVKIMKNYSKIILENGGVMRSIENHGIRPLAEKAKRKFATADGERYFWEARYITATFDAAPRVLIETDRLLKNEDGVLRNFVVKKGSSFDHVRVNSYRNIYAGAKPTRFKSIEQVNPTQY